MLSKEWAEQFEADNGTFSEAAEAAASRYCEITGSKGWYIDRIYLEEGQIIFEGDEYWRYGGHEHHINSLPLRAIYDESYFEELEAEKREEKRKAKQAAQRRKRTAAKRKREEDLKTLAELRERYPEEAGASV